MAANLAKASHKVTAFNIIDVAISGMTMAAEAATGADVVITMLPIGTLRWRDQF